MPNVIRSGRTPSSPNHPAGETRNPVITSSLTNSAPWRRHSSASPALNPGAGGTTPMLPAAASVMTAATSPSYVVKALSTAARSLYGTTIVSAADAPVTPGVSGRPSVATPEPADASSESTWPW